MKFTAKTRQLLLFVLLACNSHAVMCISFSLYGNETDKLSLLGFKNAISLDPQQVFVSWNDSTHFCDWEGVLCTAITPRRVTSLNLTSRGLVGQISPSLGNMSFLQSLILTQNTLSGEIPPCLGLLHRLQTLYLNNNTLQGMIPSFANNSKLQVLHLSFNNLVGQLPAYFPLSLQNLQVSGNHLTGTIPASLANSTTLNKIVCAYNQIDGNIPSEFAVFATLQYLYVGGNHLTGTFPQAILNLSTLVGLGLSFNGLSGEVPPNLLTSLPNLNRLQLGVNFFLGHIPSSFTNASSLTYIDLSSNNFTGYLPTNIGELTELLVLNLQYNQLQANGRQVRVFFDSLGNCSKLEMLSLNSNQLSGHLPSSLGNLSEHLQQLYLAKNQLSGDFPSGLANLRNLIVVALWGNRFTGVLPKWIGTLENMQAIDLNQNFFTGSIPASLSNLSRLVELYLHSNLFHGQIPPSFGNFPMLQDLYMSNNNLDDGITVDIFKITTIVNIGLSFNNLHGQIPTSIGNARQLMYISLSSNKLSGNIPNTLGECQSLEYIGLDTNILSGSIPASLGNITSLRFLNFSSNNLTGPIPTSLVNLRLLENLDVSFNNLNGEIPTNGVFSNATIARIYGNKGLCGGALALHMPACVVIHSKSSSHKESLLLKICIPIATMVSLSMVIFGILIWRKKHKSESIHIPSCPTNFPKVSFNDLARATQGFSMSNLIGRGMFSSVYQGKLAKDENMIAVKVFSLDTRGATKSFIAECNALRNVRHRNLVHVLTVCSSIDSNGNDFKAIVYDFMAQGDLDKLLYSTTDNYGSLDVELITMAQRISIVVDIADALEYLHHNNQGTMVHCDLKPSNILLDDNMIAHVGDFGLARFKVDSAESSLGSADSSSVGLIGTIGYAAPEYAGCGQVSTAADVYSFGVVLLEIFLRKRPTDDTFKDGLSIVKLTEINFPDGLMTIVDPQLILELELSQGNPTKMKEKGVSSLLSMIYIGLCCTKTSPGERTNMKEVAMKLHGIMDAYLRGN